MSTTKVTDLRKGSRVEQASGSILTVKSVKIRTHTVTVIYAEPYAPARFPKMTYPIDALVAVVA